jgi:hypothetical protein
MPHLLHFRSSLRQSALGRLHAAETLRRLSKRNRLAISHVSRYYLEMLRFDWDERKNKSNRIKHGIWFEDAIRMDAYFMIRSTPSTRIGSFYLV